MAREDMEKAQVVLASRNLAKLGVYKRFFDADGVTVVTVDEIEPDVELTEPAYTLEENAVSKAEDCLRGIGRGIVVADDSGLVFPALGDGNWPGSRVRRPEEGVELVGDAQILDYYMGRLATVPTDQRIAWFKTVLAVAAVGRQTQLFSGVLQGLILPEPRVVVPKKGFPFMGVFLVPGWGKVLGEIEQLPYEERAGFKGHRDLAFEAALPYIQQLVA